MEEKSQQSPSRSTYIGIGAVLIAAAIAGFILFGKSSDNTPCALTTAGIATISEGLTKGHGTASILSKGAIAGTVPGACKSVVEDFVEEPTAETEFKFDSPEGELEESASGLELTGSVATPPEEDSESARIIDCFIAYRETEFLYRMCLDGTIEPSP